MSKSKKEILYVFLAALAVRAIVFLFSSNQTGDPDFRALVTLNWAQHPYWLYYVDWLPVHFYLVGLAFKLIGDILLAARLVSLIFGSLAMIPFALLTRKWLNRRAWLFACIFFIFFPQHIRLSVIGMGEIVSNFLFLSCLALLFANGPDEQPTYQKVGLAGLCLLFANLNRQDTWTLTPVILAAVWWLYGFRKALFFGLVNTLILAYFGVSQIVFHQSVLGVMAWYDKHAAVDNPNTSPIPITVHWVWYLAASLSPIVALFGVMGYIRAIRERKMVVLLALLGFLLSIALYSTYIKHWHFTPRYIFTICSLLVIFAAYEMDVVLGKLHRNLRFALLGLTALLAIAIVVLTTIKKPDTLGIIGHEPKFALDMSDYLRQAIPSTEKFVIEDVEHTAAGILLRYRPSGEGISINQVIFRDDFTGRIAPHYVTRRIAKLRPRMVVLESGGEAETYLLSHSPRMLMLIKHIGPYAIYNLTDSRNVKPENL